MTRSVRWMSERPSLPGEVQSLGAGFDGAGSADLGSDGGSGGRAGRPPRRRARHEDRVFHHSAWPPRARGEIPGGTATDPAPRRRPQANAGERSNSAARSRRIGGADRRGPPDVAVALDLQERAASGGGSSVHGPPGQPATGGRTLDGGRLQSAGPPQDARGAGSSGPRRPIPVYQPAGPAVPSGHATCHLRRYEEEGTGGRLQERGAPMPPARPAGGRPSP